MVTSSRRLMLVALALLIAGCAGPPLALSPRAQADLSGAESVLLIPQAALDVDVNPTNIGGGLLDQLLAAYIDSKRKASASEAAAPITQQLAGYDFRAAMRQAWSDEFAKAGVARLAQPVRVETLEGESADGNARKRARFDASPAAAVLFAAIGYRLQSGKLIVGARLEIYPKAESLLAHRKSPDSADPLGEGNAIYRKDFSHTREFITPSNVRRHLDEAVLEVARQIAADLARPQV